MRVFALIAAVLSHVTLDAVRVPGQFTFLAEMSVEEERLVSHKGRSILGITNALWVDSLTTFRETVVLIAHNAYCRRACSLNLGLIEALEDPVITIPASCVTGEGTLLAVLYFPLDSLHTLVAISSGRACLAAGCALFTMGILILVIAWCTRLIGGVGGHFASSAI